MPNANELPLPLSGLSQPIADLLVANLLSNDQIAIIAVDTEEHIIYWNAGAERLYGWQAEEVLGLPLQSVLRYEWLHSGDQRRAEEALAETGAWVGENIHSTRDGSTRVALSSVTMLRDELGSPAGMVALIRDITERKQAEAARDQLAAIVEFSEDAIVGKSLDAVITSWNPGAERLYGYTAEEVIGRPISILLPPDRPDELPAIVERLRRGERVDHYDSERITKDGRRIQVSVTISAVRDVTGRLIGASAVARDITQRVEMERALRRSEQQLQAIFQSVAEGITVQDPTGRMLFANAAAARLIGYDSVEALLTAPRDDVLRPFEIMDEDGRPYSVDELPGSRALRGEQPPETVLRFRLLMTGEERWSAVQARPLFDERGRVEFAVNTFRDVTEHYREQQRLRYLERATSLLASSLDYETTLERVAELALPDLADWAAVDVLESDGIVRQVALAHSDPSRVTWVKELTQRYPPNPNATSGSPQVIRSGESEFLAVIPRELIEAAAVDEEHRRIIEELHLSSAITVPLRAGDRVLGAITFVYAESGRHYTEADLRLAEDLGVRAGFAVDNARLYRDAREALHVRDEFLSTISHDLRTPLTTVRGLTQLLLRQAARLDIPQRERLVASLSDIDRASRGMSRMIDELLDLSRIESGRPLMLNRERMDLVLLLRQLVEEHRRAAPGHRMNVDAPPGGMTGFWDPLRLERAFENLLSNAVKYSPNGGLITVSLHGPGRDAAEDDWVEVRVSDEGIGIPAADLPHIFDRYHRASNVVGHLPGIGVGLAGAKQIIEQHGGTLSAESEEGRGSVFIVRLPREQHEQ